MNSMQAFPDHGHTSEITLSRTALHENVAYLRNRVLPTTEIAAVVKGNAYGHGIENMVRMCVDEGISTFCVFSAYEANRVLQCCRKHRLRIIIMGFIADEMLEWAITSGIEMFVYSEDRLKQLAKLAAHLKQKARIHLEVETGMHRTGFEQEKLSCLLNFFLQHAHHFSIEGLCTHFAGAEEIANHVRVSQQKKAIRWWRRQFRKEGIPVRQVHAACSAGLINYPEAQFDLVRVGIMLYGFWPSLETRIMQLRHQPDPLRRLIRWTSQVMHVKTVKLGEYVGYGSSYLSTSNMLIAIVPVGYAYGFSRSLSNDGRVLIGGQPMPVISMVNMNLLIVNVSDLPETKVGDEVVLIGRQGEHEISVSSFSEMSQQLNYEMLTRLPADIPRHIID